MDSFLIKAVVIIVVIVLFIKYILPILMFFIGSYFKWLLRTCLLLIPLIFFVPTHYDEILYFIVIGIIAVIGCFSDSSIGYSRGYTGYSSSSDDYDFVLNKRTRVAFRRGDPDIYTISEQNREYSNDSEEELFRKGYRLKRDP